MILVCDVGGTKIDTGFVSAKPHIGKDSNASQIVGRQTISARDCTDFVKLLLQRADAAPSSVSQVALAVAGPVIDSRCIQLTNLPWAIDLDQVANAFPGARVSIVNDLEAMAGGITHLTDADLATIQVGEAMQGHRCVIAAGTGLGEAFLVWTGQGYRPIGCEGGHTDFAPQQDEDLELWRFAQKRFGHVSWERLVSGGYGFATLVGYFRSLGGSPSGGLEADLQVAAGSPGKALLEWADKGEPFAEAVVRKFVSLYGAEAGNLALKTMARGGVYVGGGIAPKLIEWLKKPELFLRAFSDKGRFASFLAKIPIHVIVSDRVLLLGAAQAAQTVSAERD